MATVPTPATQTAGLAVPAATINSQGNLATYLAGRTESGGARRPLCVMRQTVTQALTAATNTAITFDTEDVDYDNGHSTVTNTSRYTANTAGWYLVSYIGAMSSGTGNRQAWLRINGTGAVNASSVFSNTQAQIGAARIVFLNAGDYIELMVASSVGVSTDATLQSQSMMAVQWVSV